MDFGEAPPISTPAGNPGCPDIRGLEISLSERVEGITSRLPIHYCMVRSHMGLVPPAATGGSGDAQPSPSVNWSQGDCSIEVVDGLQGKTVEE